LYRRFLGIADFLVSPIFSFLSPIFIVDFFFSVQSPLVASTWQEDHRR